jgi:hypothetical protein
MAKILRLRDYINLDKPVIYKDSEELLSDIFTSHNPAHYRLKVNIRATHSGYLLNGRVYPGVHMKDSVGTWFSKDRGGTSAYDKPILTHHDSLGEPIGRVINATYTQLTQGEVFEKDWKNPASGTDMGSGFILVEGIITDPASVQKIVDGRYSTVSSGHRTTNAICSVCGIDWLSNNSEDDICEHRPGRSYEIDGSNYKCYLVTGPLDFDELSYVNMPAQPNAKTIGANIEALEATINNPSISPDTSVVFTSLSDNGATNSLVLEDSDGNSIDFIVRDGQSNELPDEYKDLLKKTAISVPQLPKVTPTDKADEIISKSVSKDNSDNTEPEPETAEITDEEFALIYTAKGIIDADILDESEDCDCEFSIEDIKNLASKMIDAKLSSEQRKKLKSSTFCGPGRSFPVPDCAHVTAARRLIGRAKVSSSTKQRILSCVSRKAKQLGCGGSKDDSKDFDKKVKSMEDKSKNVSDFALEDAVEALSIAKSQLEDKCAELEASLQEKAEICKSLSEENADLKQKLIEYSARQLAVMRVNLAKPGTLGVNSKDKFEEYVTKLCERSIDSLNDAVMDLLPEVELMIRNKSRSDKILNSEVSDPTLVRPESKKDETIDGKRVMDKQEFVKSEL